MSWFWVLGVWIVFNRLNKKWLEVVFNIYSVLWFVDLFDCWLLIEWMLWAVDLSVIWRPQCVVIRYLIVSLLECVEPFWQSIYVIFGKNVNELCLICCIMCWIHSGRKFCSIGLGEVRSPNIIWRWGFLFSFCSVFCGWSLAWMIPFSRCLTCC